MTAKFIEIGIMETIAALLFWFSHAIGVKRKMEFIAGYNEKTARQVADKAGLARLVGRLCLLAGLATASMPVVTTIWGHPATSFSAAMGAYGGFLLGLVSLTFLQVRDYTTAKGLHDKGS